jgi:hypothetical protein
LGQNENCWPEAQLPEKRKPQATNNIGNLGLREKSAYKQGEIKLTKRCFISVHLIRQKKNKKFRRREIFSKIRTQSPCWI